MRRAVGLLLAALTLLGASWVSAQNYPEDEQVASELRALTRAVEKIAAHLEIQQQQQLEDVRFRQLDLAIAYLNFRSRRIESVERDIEMQRNIRSRLEENLPVITERIRDVESRIQDYPQGAPEELRDAHDELLSQRDLIRERISRIDDQLVMRENLLYELQGQIRDIEAFVQRNLEM